MRDLLFIHIISVNKILRHFVILCCNLQKKIGILSMLFSACKTQI